MVSALVLQRRQLLGFAANLSLFPLFSQLGWSFGTSDVVISRDEIYQDWVKELQSDLHKHLRAPRLWHWLETDDGTWKRLTPDGPDQGNVLIDIKSYIGLGDPTHRVQHAFDEQGFLTKAVVGTGVVTNKKSTWLGNNYLALTFLVSLGEVKRSVVFADSGFGIDLFVFSTSNSSLFDLYVRQAEQFFTAWNDIRVTSLPNQEAHASLLKQTQVPQGGAVNPSDPLKGTLDLMHKQDRWLGTFIQNDVKDMQTRQRILNKQQGIK